ncbi:helix-turn-helix transcriptional regulator [uncultured Brevundimonas sp.]|uniref:helix-turn-helix domain-containing protein n=1 Tax=uncultured Brevundimonas sp. TaxID=213418 RepID=UPI00261C1F34|nr:helix-turn-helix transcriptional regulator [uncultured Brevundimonas sp.]
MARASNNPLRKVLAENLRRLRANRGLSQEGLADEAQLHRTFVGAVERCERNISLDNIEKLARALRVAPYELLRPRLDPLVVGLQET